MPKRSIRKRLHLSYRHDVVVQLTFNRYVTEKQAREYAAAMVATGVESVALEIAGIPEGTHRRTTKVRAMERVLRGALSRRTASVREMLQTPEKPEGPQSPMV